LGDSPMKSFGNDRTGIARLTRRIARLWLSVVV
jgi:hypothetical protein